MFGKKNAKHTKIFLPFQKTLIRQNESILEKSENYREDEVKTHLKNLCKKLDSTPHHLKIIRSVEKFLTREISFWSFNVVAIRVKMYTSSKRLGIQANYYYMFQQSLCSLSNTKTLQEEIKQRVWLCPSLIQCRYYHSIVLHRCIRQNLLETHLWYYLKQQQIRHKSAYSNPKLKSDLNSEWLMRAYCFRRSLWWVEILQWWRWIS